MIKYLRTIQRDAIRSLLLKGKVLSVGLLLDEDNQCYKSELNDTVNLECKTIQDIVGAEVDSNDRRVR